MIVVYSASRNLYPYLMATVQSLLDHNQVDKIYLMIEDDRLPYDVPDVCECINVSGQTYFTQESPNYRSCFTYMALMRSAYTKLFDAERVIQLDVDTIVCDSLEQIWQTDLHGKWLSACPEYKGTWRPYGAKYYNIGVAVFNLEQIRRDGIDDDVIKFLQTQKVPYLEQDAWNYYGLAAGKIVDMPIRFNECFATGETDRPAIVHYAGFSNWMHDRVPRVEYLNIYRKCYRCIENREK